MLQLLRNACVEVQKEVMTLVGTPIGNTTVGVGAGGDVSRKIDIIAENTVMNYMKKHGKNPTIIGEECGIVEGDSGDGYLIMDALNGMPTRQGVYPFFVVPWHTLQFPN